MAPRRRLGGRNILSLFVNGEKADDFEFFLAGGGEHLHLVADLAIEEGAADGGRGGDHSLFDVGFFAADELVFDFLALLHVDDYDARAVAGTVFRNIGEVQHAEVTHALFEVADFGIDVALALLGVLVLGVFGEVSVGASYSNLLGKVDVEFVLQRVNFLLELLFDFGKRVRHSFPRQRKMMRSPAWPDSAENIIDGGEMSRQEGKGTETALIQLKLCTIHQLHRSVSCQRTRSSTVWETLFPAAPTMESVYAVVFRGEMFRHRVWEGQTSPAGGSRVTVLALATS